MVVRRLYPDDFECYRTIRLESLRADPQAFGSTYQQEVDLDDDHWRARLEGLAGPAAFFVDEPEGQAGEPGPAWATAGIAYTEHDPHPMLLAMWVRPSARGRGCGRRLVDAAVAWAVDQAADEMVLWVVRENEAAIELYRSMGFLPSGTVQALPSNPCADELEMRLDLRSR